MFLSKYGVARIIYIPIIKRAVVDFALNADWTPAAGDVKITKDGGAAANVTNLPTALTMGNTALWLFSLTATEMQAAQIVVTVSDSATKAVEDQSFIIETYGNASGQHEIDLDQPKLDANVTHWLGTAAATPTVAGVPEVDVTHWIGTAAATPTIAGIPEVDVTHFNGVAGTFSAGRPEVNTSHAAGTAWGSGAITAASIATGAIDADALAADAVAEIADGVWDEDATGHQTQGTFGQAIGDPVADTGTIYKAVVTDATGATVGIDVVALKAETVTILADTNDIQTRIPAALVSGRIDASVGAMAANVLTATAINADAITDAKVAADVTIASVTGAVGSVTGAVGSVTGAVGSVTGNVGGNVVGSVASVTAGVTLAASAVQAIWDALTSALTTVGSIGKLLVDNIDAAISSRLATASYTAPLDAAGTRTAVGLASANLDTQIDALPTNAELATALGTADDATLAAIAAEAVKTAAIKAKTDLIPAAPAAVSDIPTADANADALLDRAAGVETGLTVRQAFRLWASVLLGKLSGGGTATEVFRDTNDTKDRITATVDSSGNRTNVTRDAT